MTDGLAILAFGAHPDDVEIGAAGILAAHARNGEAVGICNLTLAEMSTNGTPEQRQEEAEAAAKILGVDTRIQLNLGDRRLRTDKEMIDAVVRVIRQYRPAVVLSPPAKDRHPDHEWCFQIVREALFSAGLRKYRIEAVELEPYRPSFYYQYMINDTHAPALLVDVTSVYDLKREALSAYRSQFVESNQAAKTALNGGTFLRAVEGRDALFGQSAGVEFAEGLVSAAPILVSSLTNGCLRKEM